MKVSIVIPIYNVERFLPRCLDSVLEQTHEDIELILVNDCGSDNSWDIAKEYAQQNSRIVLLDSKCNHGTMIARNKGVAISTGEYLVYLDSDDYIPRNAIEILLNRAKQSCADIVAGTIRYEKSNGDVEDKSCTLPFGSSIIGVYKALLANKLTHNLCGKLFRTSLLKDKDYMSFDKMTNAEDACLFYQLVDRIAFMDTTSEVVYIYCQNAESSMNKKFSINQVQNILTFNTTLLPLIKKYPSLEKEFRHSITGSIVRLYLHGLPAKKVHEMVKRSGLGEYDKLNNIFSTLSLHELLYYTKIWFIGFP